MSHNAHQQVDFDEVNCLCRTAVRLIAQGSYAEAEQKLVAAQAIMAVLPKMSAKGGKAGTTMEWDAESIDRAIKNVRFLQTAKTNAATGGIQTIALSFRPARLSEA